MGALANPDIFKAYDIRGLYGTELDADIAELIGRAFARVISEQEGKSPSDLRLGLGRDMRLEAPEMAAALREQGEEVPEEQPLFPLAIIAGDGDQYVVPDGPADR